MNKVVTDDYPAAKLPADLRKPFPSDSTVRVTIERRDFRQTKSISEIRAKIERARDAGNWPATTSDEAVSRIRALRDEWDD